MMRMPGHTSSSSSIMRSHFLLSMTLIAAPVARAFSIRDGAPAVPASSSLLDVASPATTSARRGEAECRRTFLRQLTSGATAGVVSLLALPPSRPARAIVATAPTLDPSVALRTVKSSLRRLRAEAFADYVAFNEYESLRKALRDSPFSELRKSCTSLIRTAQGGGETGDTTTPSTEAGRAPAGSAADDLSSKYKTFIASLERMDATASVATRGRQLEPGELKTAYSDTVTSLEAFLNAAQDAVGTSVPPRPDSFESA